MVEDDIISQLVIKKICQSNKWELKISNDGVEALEILSISSFDVILMDIQLPKLSGFDTAKRI